MATYLNRDITLKDGRKVTFRLMEKTDRDNLLQFFQELNPKDLLNMRDDVTNPAVIQKWVNKLNFENVIPIMAIHEGKIVGDGTLHRDSHGWMRHVGEVRISVHPDFQRVGLGYALARELFIMAGNFNIDKMVATMMDHQDGAIRMFERLGFKEECRLKKHVIDAKNIKRDLVVMTVDLIELERRMEDAISELEDRGGAGG